MEELGTLPSERAAVSSRASLWGCGRPRAPQPAVETPCPGAFPQFSSLELRAFCWARFSWAANEGAKSQCH